jgi:hypothetical protein
MLNCWLLSLGACALGVGTANAQANPAHGEPRAFLPAGLQAPANHPPEGALIREFAGRGVERAMQFAPLDWSGRSFANAEPGLPARVAEARSANRDAVLFREQAGEPAKMMPEPSDRRATPAATGRSAEPLSPALPVDRHLNDAGAGNRRQGG